MLSHRFSLHFETTGVVENNVNLKELMKENGIFKKKKKIHKVFSLGAMYLQEFNSVTMLLCSLPVLLNIS